MLSLTMIYLCIYRWEFIHLVLLEYHLFCFPLIVLCYSFNHVITGIAQMQFFLSKTYTDSYFNLNQKFLCFNIMKHKRQLIWKMSSNDFCKTYISINDSVSCYGQILCWRKDMLWCNNTQEEDSIFFTFIWWWFSPMLLFFYFHLYLKHMYLFHSFSYLKSF